MGFFLGCPRLHDSPLPRRPSPAPPPRRPSPSAASCLGLRRPSAPGASPLTRRPLLACAAASLSSLAPHLLPSALDAARAARREASPLDLHAGARSGCCAFPAPMHRFSCSSRPLFSFMAYATHLCSAPRVSPHMVLPYLPVRRVSGFRREPRNMATNSRVKGNESGKPYIGASISPANVITISQDNKHSAAIHGMRNIDTRGTPLEVITGDERSDKDACRATSEVIYGKGDALGQIAKHASFQKQIVKHTCCGEDDQRRATDDDMEESIGSAGREVSDDEVDIVNNILAESRHRDGSIYRDMDIMWKVDYCIADRNESSQNVISSTSNI